LTTESRRRTARKQPAGANRAVRRPPSDLPRELVAGYAIARLARLVARNATRRVGDVLGLTLAEWRVLLVLEEDGEDQLDEVARRALLEASHASVAATSLRQRGLIDRSIHQRDRRRVCLRRTPAGTRAVRQYLRQTAAERRALWRVLSDAERGNLVQLLARLIEAAVGLGYEDAAVRKRGRPRA
jgi:MarR family transcriptional regulator, lower aerobic nicotinate degradation pathway regulator